MKVGIVSCSNGQQPEQTGKINQLIAALSRMGIGCVQSGHLYAKDGIFSGTAKERAKDLMEFYRDSHIDAIYDISGGDVANEVLGYLDYGTIAESGKMLWGYSDLTTVINAVYAKTGKPSVLYQAAKALIGYARTELGFCHFTAHCDSENIASYRVMEKLGMKRAGSYGGRKNRLSDEERMEYLYRM